MLEGQLQSVGPVQKIGRSSSLDKPTSNFIQACSLDELKAKGRIVVRGCHRPTLLLYQEGHVVTLDNRCPHIRPVRY